MGTVAFVACYAKRYIPELAKHRPLVFAFVRHQIDSDRTPAPLRATQKLDDETHWRTGLRILVWDSKETPMHILLRV